MLGWLERNQLLVLAASCLVLAVAAVAAYAAGNDSSPDIVFRSDAELPEGAPILVHVAGAVASPGVYELRQGDRLFDALDAAGGASAGAVLDELNLARRLRDGEQVLVPGPTRTAAGGATTRPAPLAPGAKLDINTASETELDALPGVGEAYSRRIVDSRKVDGPYRTTEDLVARKVIPRATYDQIRDLIVVSTP